MFNLQGSEIIFILLLALVVLGPEKLPGAIKRATQTYNELRKMSSGFQSEFKSAIDEPMREMRATADLIKDQVDPKQIADAAEKSASASAAADRVDAARATGDSSETAEGADSASGAEPADPFDDPLEESA
ncbi:Sec-independent protein translocase subunit TatA/TatB [Ilumatobacter sp.]|uniref:Sec-independent protein translocase subunit TatA/TatB n=1 Tax=Ilumatobacter sp. TaxID=1967498 RepID=UPI003C36BF03